MKEYQFYLFDIDDTLLDTGELITHCFEIVCRRIHHLDIEPEQVHPLIGLPLKKMFEILLIDVQNVDFDLMIQEYRKYQFEVYDQRLKLFPNVKSTLHELYRTGKQIAAVTSRRKDSLQIFLKATQIDSYFHALITPEDTTEHKPCSAPALKAMKELNGTSGSAIFVGDSQFDIECGHRSGMDTGFVLWSNLTPNSLPITPTYIINDLSMLLNFPD